jgi:hypothetical protein
MTTIKLLSAGFIAIAMLTTSAAAHATSMTGRHAVLEVSASANASSARWIYGHARIAGESDSAPQNQSGGVCDHGDNPAIC